MTPNVVPLFPAMPAFRPPQAVRPDLRGVEAARLCRVASAIAAAAFDVPPEEMSARTRRTADVVAARHVAIYLANVVFQVSLQKVADVFGRDRTSIGHAVRRVEDRRDEPDFDARVEKLERIASVYRAGCER
ncbi:helix-turn-helix domain-containing protein [Aureimonas mangrovi]|uniref:helix-turn-helix domain-containing protein n=1 Tax=Aureimonas mangrovi TaxID=2758041 RepID=UPI00163DDE16|nr:helix-turn-helix domain-containing protein [Aureimonas mangrovi]